MSFTAYSMIFSLQGLHTHASYVFIPYVVGVHSSGVVPSRGARELTRYSRTDRRKDVLCPFIPLVAETVELVRSIVIVNPRDTMFIDQIACLRNSKIANFNGFLIWEFECWCHFSEATVVAVVTGNISNSVTILQEDYLMVQTAYPGDLESMELGCYIT